MKRRPLQRDSSISSGSSKTDVIIFDKTGTLTTGVPGVVEVITAKGTTESTLMTLCASAEARHEHPVAKALKAYAEKSTMNFPNLTRKARSTTWEWDFRWWSRGPSRSDRPSHLDGEPKA